MPSAARRRQALRRRHPRFSHPRSRAIEPPQPSAARLPNSATSRREDRRAKARTPLALVARIACTPVEMQWCVVVETDREKRRDHRLMPARLERIGDPARIFKRPRDENAHYLSFPRKRESRRPKAGLPAFAGMTAKGWWRVHSTVRATLRHARLQRRALAAAGVARGFARIVSERQRKMRRGMIAAVGRQHLAAERQRVAGERREPCNRRTAGQPSSAAWNARSQVSAISVGT